jgi:hypothetical protein
LWDVLWGDPPAGAGASGWPPCYRSGVRTVREIVVSDRLWSALERLAGELGTERDSLVEQALHAFLRFHGLTGDPPVAAPAPPAPRQAEGGEDHRRRFA